MSERRGRAALSKLAEEPRPAEDAAGYTLTRGRAFPALHEEQPLTMILFAHSRLIKQEFASLPHPLSLHALPCPSSCRVLFLDFFPLPLVDTVYSIICVKKVDSSTAFFLLLIKPSI